MCQSVLNNNSKDHNLIIHVPHASTHIPENLRKDFIVESSLQPSLFQNADSRWDIITVSHNSRRKCLQDTLYIIRNSLDVNPGLTALIIVNAPSRKYTSNTSDTEVNFLKFYYKNFSYKERRQIVLLRLSPELGLEGVSPAFITWCLQSSKVFLFSSKKEGSAN